MSIVDDGQRTCSNCDTRYYDPNRNIIHSPICKNCFNQPERLSEKTYYRNEDGTYPPLEPVIGCDSPNSENK